MATDKRESVAEVNRLLERQAELTRQLAEMERRRVSDSGDIEAYRRLELRGIDDQIRKSEAAAAAEQRSIEQRKKAYREWGSVVTGAVGGIIQDVGRAITSVGSISLTQGIQQVRTFEDATARLAIAQRRDVAEVRGQFEKLGLEIGEQPDVIAAWSRRLGQLTYDFDGAAKAARGIAEEGAANGRSIDEYLPLAETLQTVGRVAGDVGPMLGTIRAQAKALETVGGPAALQDQIVNVREELGRLAIEGPKDTAKITGFIGALGKGLQPGQAKQVQKKAFGMVTSDPGRFEGYLGREITDEKGNVKDIEKVFLDTIKKLEKDVGKKGLRKAMMDPANFGGGLGARLHTMYTRGELGAARPMEAGKQEDRLQAFLATDAGKRALNEAKARIAMRGVAGSGTLLGRAADAYQSFAAEHPIVSKIAEYGGGSLATKLAQRGSMTLLEGLAGGRGAQIASRAGQFAARGASGAADFLSAVPNLAPLASLAAVGAYQMKALANLKVDPVEYRRQAVAGGFGAYAGASMQAGRARALVRARAAAGDDLPAFVREAGRPLLAQAEDDPALRQVAQGLASSQVDISQLPPEIGRAVAEAVKETGVQVTVINATGGPIEAVATASAGAAAGAQ